MMILQIISIKAQENPIKFNPNSEVTVVITSCDRLDLLKPTLDSFFKYNTYPIKRLIISEDSLKVKRKEIRNCCVPKEATKNDYLIIINPKNLGQIGSIDNAY
jgi:hypothetical protein